MRRSRPRSSLNFAPIDPGLYRGGQPSPDEIAALARDLQVRTIIRLNRGSAVADRSAARLAGINLIEIPIDPKGIGTSDAATTAATERALQAFTDPKNAPVYLYCDHGRDRTGYVVGLYRARRLGWSFPQIRDELARHGHGPIMRRYLPNITRQLESEVARRGVAH